MHFTSRLASRSEACGSKFGEIGGLMEIGGPMETGSPMETGGLL